MSGQQRRVDSPGEVSQVLEGLDGFGLDLRDHPSRLLEVAIEHPSDQPLLHGQSDELLLCRIVDVPLDPAALLVLRRHEPLTRGPQIRDQRRVAQDQPGLRRDVGDQTLLRRRHRLVRRHRDYDRAQRLALMTNLEDTVGKLVDVSDGRRLRRVPGPARGGSELCAGSKPDLHAGSPGPLGQDPRHSGKDIVDRVGVGEPVGELRKDLVRTGPFAVHEAVRHTVRPPADRLELEGDRRGP